MTHMTPYCLCKEELRRFIEIEMEGQKPREDEAEFEFVLSGWQTWDIELICLATALSQLLEHKIKSKEDVFSLLTEINNLLADTGRWLNVEGFDEEFVSYMLSFVRDPSLSIEDNLVMIRSQLSEYRYQRH